MKYLYRGTCILLCFIISQHALSQDFSSLKSQGEVPGSVYEYSLGDNVNGTSKDFVLEYEYALRTIFRSGKVLFGDSLTNYVRKCADYIYEKNPDIKVATEFFVLKSTTPNAFAFPNGYIFVTTGLLGQAENEAQLCFIIAHEITHVQKKHGWESFTEKTDILKGRGEYSGLSLENRLNLALQKSKSHELDADNEGYKLFKNLGYDNRQVLRAFDMLLYSYLPFDEIEFDYSFLSDSLYKFPTSFTTYKTNDISASENEDDEGLTHPNVKKRKQAILEIAHDTGTNKYFILNEGYFKRVQQLARYENLYINVSQGQLDKALYNTFLIERHYGKSLYTAKVKAYALVNYAISKSNGNLNSSDFRLGTKEVQGNTQSITHLLKSFKSKDALIAAKRALLEGKRTYNHPFFTTLNSSLDKVYESKWRSIYPSLFFENKGGLTTFNQGSSKIDKLKNIGISNKKDSGTYYNWALYNLNPTEEEQEWLGFTKEGLIEEFNKNNEDEDDEDDYPVSDSHKKKKNSITDKEQDDKNKISEVVLLKPNVLRVKEKMKGYKMNKLSDEELSSNILESMLSMSGDFRNEFKMLDPITSQSNLDEYNNYAFVKDWMNTYHILNGELVPFQALDSTNQDYISPGTVFVNTNVLSFKGRKEFNYLHLLVVIMVPYAIPYVIYYYLRKEYTTIINLTAYDIGRNITVSENFSYFEAKSSKDYIKSHIYAIFYSFLNNKK